MKMSALMAATALAASLLAGAASAEDPVVLKFASPFPAGSITNQSSVPEFIRAVEEASEGTLKIEHYPGGTLGANPAAQLKLIEDGVIDMSEVVASYTPGRFPELEIFELPFTFDSTRQASLAAWKLYEDGKLSGFDKVALVGLALPGPYFVHTKGETASVSDLAGLKLRAGGPMQGAVIGDLGAVPVGGIAATQVAENISRGVLDGALMDFGNLYNFRIADATAYHIVNAPLGNVAVLFPINRAKYESLPPKAKAALDKFAGAWFTEVLAENLDKQNETSIAKLKEAPDAHHFVELPQADLDALKAKMAPLKDKWDVEKGGANLYQDMMQARDAVPAKQ